MRNPILDLQKKIDILEITIARLRTKEGLFEEFKKRYNSLEEQHMMLEDRYKSLERAYNRLTDVNLRMVRSIEPISEEKRQADELERQERRALYESILKVKHVTFSWRSLARLVNCPPATFTRLKYGDKIATKHMQNIRAWVAQKELAPTYGAKPETTFSLSAEGYQA